MKIISTKTHGILDYVVGLLLIISPWLFGFADIEPAKWIPIVLGVMAFLYSIITNYELGVFKTISMKTHLTLDFLSGMLLAASPWIFGFADSIYVPNLLLGIFEIAAAWMTKTAPSTSYSNMKHSHAM